MLLAHIMGMPIEELLIAVIASGIGGLTLKRRRRPH